MAHDRGWLGRHAGTPSMYRRATAVKQEMESEEGTEAVMKRLEEMRRKVLRPERAYLHLAADLVSSFLLFIFTIFKVL